MLPICADAAETLRTKVDDFCSRVYMGFDLVSEITSKSTKYVFLDEFEKASSAYQDALKAYIENFSEDANVKFIFNTNHISKISPGLRSRLIQIDFDPQNIEEEKFLKKSIGMRIWNDIIPKENIKIEKSEIVSIINKHFPDFRSILNSLEYYKIVGEVSGGINLNQKNREELYNYLFSTSSYEEIYHYLMNNFGDTKIDEMLKMLGSEFVEWVFLNNRNSIEKLFKINKIVADNYTLLENSADPIIIGMKTIGEIREVFILNS
jgi:DNA polymerase III delta prime subunit